MNVWNGNEDLALEECKLLSGGFATFLQVLLGIIALSVLVVKRYHEVPRRPVTIWAFDASKQMIGAGFAHVANLLIAIMLYQYEHGHGSGTTGVDQCAFYFVNFTMDTTVGVLFNWMFLEMVSSLAVRFQFTSLTTPGDYGDPIQVSIWLKQLVSWIFIIFLTKLVIALVIVALEKPLGDLAMWLFAPLQPYPNVELAIVMILCPCLMNALQFWVQDSFLKKDVRADCVLASTLSPDKPGAFEKTSVPRASEINKCLDMSPSKDSVEDDDAYASDGSTATSASTVSKTDAAIGDVV
ncbi:hypothetical protein PINS_up010431 [Pythium insidiosum]|nr:hypothetical protein PINS_up010431 [Pythium insidiosum]